MGKAKSTAHEHPLLLTTALVKATLAGTKTRTARPVTSANSLVDGFPDAKLFASLVWDDRVFVDRGPSPAGNQGPYLRVYDNLGDDALHRVYPRVQPGDVLWVRETWLVLVPEHRPPRFAYRADGVSDHSEEARRAGYPYQWKPSIHMPRTAARLLLPVVSVGAGRPIDITEQDALAEGTGVARIQHARTPSGGPIRDAFWNCYASIYGEPALTQWAWSYAWKAVG